MRSLVFFTLLLVSTAASAIDVGVCYAVPDLSYQSDVESKLALDGRIRTLTSIDCGAETPTLDDLLLFDAVLFYSDSGFADRVGLGEVLADYVDAGGGAVEAVFSVADNLKVEGRFLTDGYRAFVTESQSSGSLSMIVDLPGHPILDGVVEFGGGASSYHGDTAVPEVGATLVASWTDGDGLIAEHTPSGAGAVVALNFYPPSSDIRDDFWDASTDGERILANSLVFAAGSGMELVVAGACPGEMTLDISGMTADDEIALLSSQDEGAAAIPGGPCIGVLSGLSPTGFRLRGVFPSGPDGVFALRPWIPDRACGAAVQVLDLATCALTNVGRL